MKASKLIMLLLALHCISYCNAQTIERENGWYYIMEGRKDSISKESIYNSQRFCLSKIGFFLILG